MGISRPKNSLPAGLGDPLDRAVEASLRRQFVVPAPLANPGTAVPLTNWQWPTLNIELRIPRLGLRAAAGLLLAASLWGASGLIVLGQLRSGSGGPRYAAAAPAGSAITSDTALGRLTMEFARPARLKRVNQEQGEEHEAQLWQALGVEMGERYGEAMQQHVAELRESDGIELLDVRKEFAENESLLMLAARVEGQLTVALIESTEDGAPRLRLPPDDRPQIGGPAGLGMSGDARLFRGRVEEGIGYEINAKGSPALIPLLFEGVQMRSLMRVYPERYRSPQGASVASTMP